MYIILFYDGSSLPGQIWDINYWRGGGAVYLCSAQKKNQNQNRGARYETFRALCLESLFFPKQEQNDII